MKTIYFVTSNKNKVEEFANRVNNLAYKIEQLSADLSEPQELDSTKVVQEKLRQAKLLKSREPVLVDDRGLYIPALENFPGPFLKMVMSSIGTAGLIKLMEGQKDRTANYIVALGYFDGQKDWYFIDVEHATLLDTAKGHNIRGWGNLMSIYSHGMYPGRSLAELNDDEWQNYVEVTSNNNHIQKFIDHIKSKNGKDI